MNEYSARLVAGGVVVLTSAYLATGLLPILVVVVYGFVARVATGPTLSPLGQLVTRRLTPRLEAALGRRGPAVAGPPKRFAQGIGATLSIAALAAHLDGAGLVAFALVAAITVAATVESVFGYCIGCTIFRWLMRAGLVPEHVCAECADITSRLRPAPTTG